MRKLIMMSLFALGSMVSFAGNGEKENLSGNLNTVNVENPSMVQSEEKLFSHTDKYEIWGHFFVCDPNGVGTDFYMLIAEDNGQCLDATQVALLVAAHQTIIDLTYPDACEIIVYAVPLNDLSCP